MGILFKLFKIGYDDEGYNRFGYDNDGYDRLGYDRNGHKKKSDVKRIQSQQILMEKKNINPESKNEQYFTEFEYNYVNQGHEIKEETGMNRASYHEVVFRNAVLEYENDNINGGHELALCYLNGVGVEQNTDKALSILTDCAYKNSSKCLRTLGELYDKGKHVSQDKVLANFLYDLSENKHTQSISSYKAMTPTVFVGKSKDDLHIFEKEKNQLFNIIEYIRKDIRGLTSKLISVDTSTNWMDRDQLESWRIDKTSNRRKLNKTEKLEEIMSNPYYARMDTEISGNIETYYIGEESYETPNSSIVSVWSKYGRMYRYSNIQAFSINEYDYKVKLRRRLLIKNGELIEVFDEFNHNNNAAKAQITDPYLLRILEEKKGEDGLTNIIRSIQLNQNQIIEYDFDKSLIVQGCAGSGKTMILLHRLANMQYNLSHFDPNKIKIITPSKQFNLFIDELSKNLKINEIEKMTINEYFISLFGKYRKSHQKRIEVKKHIIENGLETEVSEYKSVETGPSTKEELKTELSDATMDHKIVSYIYSDEFIELMSNKVNGLFGEQGVKLDYGSAIKDFGSIMKDILDQFGIDMRKTNNHTCILYSKLLFLFKYYGELRLIDTLLCIDEGQDISISQYKLLNSVNDLKTTFNIYGDLKQNVYDYKGMYTWAELKSAINAKVFVLNENYRNSEEIVEFYNKELNLSHRSFGLRTKDVKTVGIHSLSDMIKMQLILNNRTAIITKNHHNLPIEIRDLTSNKMEEKSRAILLNVIDVKGLEFDTVFVIEDEMNDNEKYISFTRALSELNILENVTSIAGHKVIGSLGN